MPQPSADAMDVLRTCAKEARVPNAILHVVEALDTSGAPEPLHLGLAGEHQQTNAALAVALVAQLLGLSLTVSPEVSSSRADSGTDSSTARVVGTSSLKLGLEVAGITSGLAQASWPGRCQTIQDGLRPQLAWYLDGAHTAKSMVLCAGWFASQTVESTKAAEHVPGERILVFNCAHEKNVADLLIPLVSSGFDHVVFCPVCAFGLGEGIFKHKTRVNPCTRTSLKILHAFFRPRPADHPDTCPRPWGKS